MIDLPSNFTAAEISVNSLLSNILIGTSSLSNIDLALSAKHKAQIHTKRYWFCITDSVSYNSSCNYCR